MGDEGIYDRENNITKIYGNTLLRKNIEQDTFYLSSDTILAFDSENDMSKLYAYNNVKFYKNNFIGKTDSVVFLVKDSLLEMYNEPIIWNNNNQISSDTIKFKIIDDRIDEMNLMRNSFIISQNTLGNFNQIKGRNMKADFYDNDFLKSIEVFGNGETIYFGINEEANSIIGLNYIVCSDLKLNFNENEIENIVFYRNPKAKMIPPMRLKKQTYI